MVARRRKRHAVPASSMRIRKLHEKLRSWARTLVVGAFSLACVSCSSARRAAPLDPKADGAAPPATTSDAGAVATEAGVDAGEDAGHAAARDAGSCRDWPHSPLGAAGLPRAVAPPPDEDDAGALEQATPQLSDGPIVGSTTNERATLWVRADKSADWAVRIWPKDAPDQARRIYGQALENANDFTGVLEVAGLKPSTVYGYRLELGARGAGLSTLEARGGEFHTLSAPGARGKLRVVLGADIGSQLKQPIFDQIGDSQPDLLLLLGDNVYADELGFDFSSYAQAYVNAWQIRTLANLLRYVPSFMIWDDHEIVDNFAPGSSARYVPARQAYELFVNAHNPAPVRPGMLYYTFDAGDVGFFVLDERSHRSPEDQVDGPDKTMLGPEQKQALFAWLRCSSARIKVIASSVTFNTSGTTGDDSWAGYPSEREELFAFIESNAIDDVLLVSGDQHWSAVFRYNRPRYRLYEFMPTPLSKSRRSPPEGESAEIIARDGDHFVFGVLDIDTALVPAHVDITLCAAGLPCDPGHEPEPKTGLDVHGAEENVPFSVHLTTDDMGVQPAR